MTEFEKALAARDHAITAVDKHAPDDWKHLAHLAGEHVARRQQLLTSEDRSRHTGMTYVWESMIWKESK